MFRKGRKVYVKLTPLVQVDGFWQYVFKSSKCWRVRLRRWFNTNTTETGGIWYLQSVGCLTVGGKCLWRHPCSVVVSFGNFDRVLVFVLWYLVHRLVKLKCDVVYNDVLMDSWQDCIFLVSNEHEIIFGDIDHKSNKSECL